jgi:hypothetical protein
MENFLNVSAACTDNFAIDLWAADARRMVKITFEKLRSPRIQKWGLSFTCSALLGRREASP